MKYKTGIIAISVFLVIILNLLLPTANVLAKELDSSEVITGKYQSSASEGDVQIENTFEYRDDCFTRSSFLGCKHLEILSIQAASASISYYGEDTDKDEINTSQNSYNIADMLEKMKFNNIKTNTYYTTEKHENSMGVIVGQKNIIQDGKTYTLLAIIPRSAGYKQEWAGNFIIGDGDIHEGFKAARDEILRFVKKYIEENNINGDLKIWTAGYSRGAAVTDMVAGFFAGGGIEYFGDKVSITPEDVYSYTIGTPRTIKNGASKNIELSVSGNRTQKEYKDDTPGEAYEYTKGGTVSTDDTVYGGIRNLISPDDIFPLLPPEGWGFTHYGNDISSKKDLNSEEMLKELKDISEYVYNKYTGNGKIGIIERKTFDLKTLSIKNNEGEVNTAEFFKERLKGLENVAKTNKIYKDEHYQDALKSLAGTFGMSETFLLQGLSIDNLNTSDIIQPLVYTYLSYASKALQEEERAENETEAVTIALEDLIAYFADEEIDKDNYTVDDFIKTIAKFISDNEEEPISDAIISGMVSLVPEDYRGLLAMFNGFDKNSETTAEKGIKAFIKACYYGADPECMYGAAYPEPENVRNLLYNMAVLPFSGDMKKDVEDLLKDEKGNLVGAGSFKDLIKIVLGEMKKVKDDDGNVVKTYSSLSEMADEKIVGLLDTFLDIIIEQSKNLYGVEYKEEFENQVNALKENITKVREIISEILFYSDKGFNTKDIVENIATFVDNATLIPLAHYYEIYLAQARYSNRYEDHYTSEDTSEEYKCIKGDGEEFNLEKNNKLEFIFSFDYDQFVAEGKIHIDNEEVSKDKYIVTKGSTVITFDDDYAKTLSEGSHSIVAEIGEESVEAEFTIAKVENNDDENTEEINENNEKENDDIKEEESTDDIKETTKKDSKDTDRENDDNNNTKENTEKNTDNKNEKDTKNNETRNSSNPITGDNIGMWVGLMMVSILGIIITTKALRKI